MFFHLCTSSRCPQCAIKRTPKSQAQHTLLARVFWHVAWLPTRTPTSKAPSHQSLFFVDRPNLLQQCLTCGGLPTKGAKPLDFQSLAGLLACFHPSIIFTLS